MTNFLMAGNGNMDLTHFQRLTMMVQLVIQMVMVSLISKSTTTNNLQIGICLQHPLFWIMVYGGMVQFQ